MEISKWIYSIGFYSRRGCDSLALPSWAMSFGGFCGVELALHPWLSPVGSAARGLGPGTPPLIPSFCRVLCIVQAPQSHTSAVPVPLVQPPAQQQEGGMEQGHDPAGVSSIFGLKKWD